MKKWVKILFTLSKCATYEQVNGQTGAQMVKNGHQIVSSCNIFWSTGLMLLIQCALESPELGEHFKCLEHYHTMLTKNSRAT